MFVPGVIISIVTFPGVIVHELAHQLFCRLFKVPVFEVCYFRTQNPVGYVIHEQASKHWQAVFISIGPFFVNTLLGFLIAFPVAIQQKFDVTGPLDFVLIYLGVSIAMHAFPSTGDAASLWGQVNKKENPLITRILVAPIVGFIYLGALGSFFWLDAAYGAAVALGVPWLILKLIA